MADWLGIKLMKYIDKRKKARWISLGLRPTKIDLDDGMTSMHCWIPNTGDTANSKSKGRKVKPILVLVHGFGCDSITAWYDQGCGLSEHYRLYIPDLVFFGQSTTTSREGRSELFQAECIKNMLIKLGVESANVVGHSYGGFVAFWMAQKYPDLVKRVAIASSALCMTPTTNTCILKHFGTNDIKDVLMPTNCNDLRKALRYTIYRLPWLPDFVFRHMLETSGGGDKEAQAQLIEALVIGSRTNHSLPELDQEVLIIWGEKDRIFRVEEARLVKRHLRKKIVKLEVLKNTGHVPPIEKPKDFNRLILQFMQN